MGLETTLVIWPGTFEQIFIPTSHGGSIWNLASNILVLFLEKKFENVESEWPWAKVNEWPWPCGVINRRVLIYLTICTNFHFTGVNSFLIIYSLTIFLYRNKRDRIWTCFKIGEGQSRVISWIHLVIHENPMPHTKFQGHRPFGSR